jgi:hypothetical protein
MYRIVDFSINPNSFIYLSKNASTVADKHKTPRKLTMLKIVKISIATAIASLIFSGNVQADINDALQNICTIVKADDKGELRKKMKRVQSDYNLKLKDYYTGVSCGGDSLIRTAMLNNSEETGTLMVKKMPKGDLKAPENDGKTVLDWASENGFDSSPIVIAINERI